MAKRRYKVRRKGAGWAMDGVRVYHVKGLRKTHKRVFRTKQAALAHLHRKRKR